MFFLHRKNPLAYVSEFCRFGIYLYLGREGWVEFALNSLSHHEVVVTKRLAGDAVSDFQSFASFGTGYRYSV